MKTALGLSGLDKFNLEDVKREFLKGNMTSVMLSKQSCFGDAWYNFSLEKQDEIVVQLCNQANNLDLINWLIKYAAVDVQAAENIANANLPDEYGNLSQAALNKIIPKLEEEVITYDKAVIRAGFSSHSALSHFEKTGEVMPALPYYGEPLMRHVGFGSGIITDPPEICFGKIANPTVHIGLNQIRLVVNEILKKYGEPTEIVVEVARDLKNSKKIRDEITKEQASKQKQNSLWRKDIAKICGREEHEIKHDDLEKMRLWTELNPKNIAERCCPFTGKMISMELLFSDEIEVEHLLPFSRSLDDSLNNKTVCFRSANRYKTNKTPDEAFNNAQARLDGYIYADILDRASLMSKYKAKRFAPNAYQIWLKEDKDFLARALNDTKYLSRIAKEYLSLICPGNSVRCIPGQMTSKLRHHYGLNRLISDDANKNRHDHRHHAIDALVVALTDS